MAESDGPSPSIVPRVWPPLGSHYEFDRELGRGGAAIVYLARDTRSGKLVAVKLLRPELASAVGARRFLQEIALMAKFRHEHLISISEWGQWDGVPFYAMPFLDGGTLRARLRDEGQLPVADAIRITQVVAGALQYTHDNGVIHRDIKPENLLFVDDDVCVADFGIAYAIERAAGDRLTSSQLLVGTPAYMSPEQAAGERHLDSRSDQYSLACVLYEMLAGVPPFTGASAGALLTQRLVHAPMPVTGHRPSVPTHVARAIERALSIAPSDRFQTITLFADALRAPDHVSDAVDVRPPGSRRRTAAITLAIGFVAVVGAGVAARLKYVSNGAKEVGTAIEPTQVAVIEFEPISSDKPLAEFAHALTQQVVVELSITPALAVTSPDGLPSCGTRIVACDSLMAARHVNRALRGSVKRSGNVVRAIVQLVDARKGTTLFSGSFDHPTADSLNIERALGQKIVVSARRWLGQEARQRDAGTGTASTRARELMLQAERARDDANELARRAAPEDLPTAFSAFHRADSLLLVVRSTDERWLRPLVTRGWLAYESSRSLPTAQRKVSLQRGLALADSALLLDSSSAGALELRGVLRWGLVELLDAAIADSTLLAGAERDLRSAVAKDPSLAIAWSTLSYLLSIKGAFAEAEQSGRRALAADAYLAGAREIIEQVFFSALMLGDYPTAREWCDYGRRALLGDWLFVQCELTLMRYDPASAPDEKRAWRLVATMDSLDPPAHARAAGRSYYPIYRRVVAATISARVGHHDVARAEIKRARAATAADPGLRLDLAPDEAYLRYVLGDRTTAAQLLRELFIARPLAKPSLMRDPLFAQSGLLGGVR